MYRLAAQPSITWSLHGPYAGKYVLRGHIPIPEGFNTNAEYWLDDDSEESIERAKARLSWAIHDVWD